jgi:hypothetical protein
VKTAFQAANAIRGSAKLMIFRGSHQATVPTRCLGISNSGWPSLALPSCVLCASNRIMMEELFFVEITFFLPEERPTGRFSESAI